MSELEGDQNVPQMVELTVRCDTSVCANYGVDIVVSAAVGGNVICGPCSSVLVETVMDAGVV